MATTIVFMVRHAKAVNRDLWNGGDRGRPLVDRGRAQAERLAVALRRERPVLIAASPWLRCRQTAAPLAAAVGLTRPTWRAGCWPPPGSTRARRWWASATAT
jgi:8-oxo-dGTP diphosphatase